MQIISTRQLRAVHRHTTLRRGWSPNPRSEIDTLPDEIDWERVDALTDEDIDAAASSDPDAPPTDASFWKDATVVMPENIVIVDADLLAWFKAHTPDYETRINAVLRSHVEANDS